MRKSVVFLMLMFVSLGATAIAESPNGGMLKTCNGTLTCLACDLRHYEGLNAQCEVFGHRHSIRLKNGDYIYFLENDHSTDLIKGGGRHNAQIEVTGFYDKKSHTIDVQSYVIDGIRTEWCADHERMDMCAQNREVQTQSSK